MKFNSIDEIKAYMLIAEFQVVLSDLPENFYFINTNRIHSFNIKIPHVDVTVLNTYPFYINKDLPAAKGYIADPACKVETTDKYPDKYKISMMKSLDRKLIILNNLEEFLELLPSNIAFTYHKPSKTFNLYRT